MREMQENVLVGGRADRHALSMVWDYGESLGTKGADGRHVSISCFQAHTPCLNSLPQDQAVCQFGSLEPIFLPPSAISIPRLQLAQHNSVPIKAIRTSISDDWSSTGFMEAAAELESSGPEREKLREKRDKERQKERQKVEKEKENEEGQNLFLQLQLCHC